MGSILNGQQNNSRIYINTGLSSGYTEGQQDHQNHNQDCFGPPKPCLEDHRLMIDCAIDRLKGELLEKDREEIQPLVLRQKKLQEQQIHNKDVVDKRITDLERMVAMQDQTIRCLLDINTQQMALKGGRQSKADPRAPSAVGSYPSPRVLSPPPIISGNAQQPVEPAGELFNPIPIQQASDLLSPIPVNFSAQHQPLDSAMPFQYEALRPIKVENQAELDRFDMAHSRERSMTPTNYYYNDEAVNKQTGQINLTSPPGPSLNMRRSFQLPSTFLQKPHTNPNQLSILAGPETMQPGPFLGRSSNMNDLSRVSLNSQSAHRVNGAPIFMQKQPDQIFSCAPEQP